MAKWRAGRQGELLCEFAAFIRNPHEIRHRPVCENFKHGGGFMKKKIAPMKNASNVARGKRVETVLGDMLRADGFIVDTRPRVKYQSLDFFGLFDLVAITPNRLRLLYIQAKRNSIRTPKETRKKMIEFEMPDCCQKIIAIYRDETEDWIVEYCWKSEHFNHGKVERFRCDFDDFIQEYYERIY